MLKTASERLLPWTVYPATLLLAIGGHLALLNAGYPLITSTYLPVLASALLVTGLEHAIPYQPGWKPVRSDIANDALFMIAVQVLLPRLLALLAVITLVDPLRNFHPAMAALWPHHWPLAAQVLLMLISAELLRYWLHRLAHTWPLLWRLHAVHHSPEKLYWLNVGRFHPLEKALQFVLDALPFMLLGVGEQVIALYFVFYSLNGFFQHSNIRLRYGPLNYLISTAELHRWHHSRISDESNHNYGNNLILWDLVFGTWFLPTERSISDIGLRNPDYPKSFAAQMRTPFLRGTTGNAAPPPDTASQPGAAPQRDTHIP
jgi:sterol desaturase/sphingolipid hydroxylase (fatty acid hydroxylase superfamily)